jgi:hypothetical protein
VTLRTRRGQRELILDYHEFQLSAAPVLFESNGTLYEQVAGRLIPRRLQFSQVEFIEGANLSNLLSELPPSQPRPHLTGSLHWRTTGRKPYYMFMVKGLEYPNLFINARRCTALERNGPVEETAYNRDWSPAPSSAPGLVPWPQRIHERYGGDPITIHLNGKPEERRLFIGGLEVQSEARPAVDVVLNLGEEPSRWLANRVLPPTDRAINRGEGSDGMSPGEIAEEAQWVIERLQAGQRVLVHCVAGMNRSSTICCGVLILLEGLSAEAALARVRQHHPWARPDSHHWLSLRWLAQN